MAVGQKAPVELLRDEPDLQYLRKPAPPKLWQDLQQSHGALLMDTGKACQRTVHHAAQHSFFDSLADVAFVCAGIVIVLQHKIQIGLRQRTDGKAGTGLKARRLLAQIDGLCCLHGEPVRMGRYKVIPDSLAI